MTRLVVNGRTHDLDLDSYRFLADVLRDDLGLFGVRVSCHEGECGSCTVLVDGLQVTSCLMLAGQAAGRAIETIEGLGTSESLHPIQQAFIDEQAFQCAFCTPGFIVSAKALLEEHPDPTEDQVAAAMSGNICRCGSYPYVVRAVLDAARRLRAGTVTDGAPR